MSLYRDLYGEGSCDDANEECVFGEYDYEGSYYFLRVKCRLPTVGDVRRVSVSQSSKGSLCQGLESIYRVGFYEFLVQIATVFWFRFFRCVGPPCRPGGCFGVGSYGSFLATGTSSCIRGGL